MKVYDCFMFNDELDLLQLRLNFLYDAVDYFVIVESRQTLSGQPKPLYFFENKHLFSSFSNKIIYVEAPSNKLPVWKYEYFQRNCIKLGLKNCQDYDLIHISDVDEIIDIKSLVPLLGSVPQPVLVKVTMFYYWFNLKTNDEWYYNLIGRWKDLKHQDIGERFVSYPLLFKKWKASKTCMGWHFSYLFGKDVKRYQNKIKSFSHQEYNKSYYLDEKRILKCVKLGVDLFERSFMSFTYSKKEITPILPYIKKLKLEKYLFEPSSKVYLQPSNITFLLRKIYVKKVIYFSLYPVRNLKKALKGLYKNLFKLKA